MEKENKQKSIYQDLKSTALPGYFTGAYFSPVRTVSLQKVSKLNQAIFKDMLNGMTEKKGGQDDPFVLSKAQKCDNGLPLISVLMNEVGTHGIIFAGGLNLCQYYKKASPSPKFF